jgi:hypothetical protein
MTMMAPSVVAASDASSPAFFQTKILLPEVPVEISTARNEYLSLYVVVYILRHGGFLDPVDCWTRG